MRFVKTHHPRVSSRRRPRDYFSRPEQYRLMLLVFACMFVVVLAVEAGKTKNWAWLFAVGSGPQQTQDGEQEPVEEDIDTRLAAEDTPPLPPGVFRALRAPDETDNPNPDLLPGLAPRLLPTIRDDTVFRRDESAAWFEILETLAAATPDEVRAWSQAETGFTQLYRQPDVFRGKVVTVRGIVRRAHRIPASRNSLRVGHLWQCWLFPQGSTNPVVVYALEMPAGFPEGLSVHEPAVVHGVFFKRWAYAAKGGIMTAPLLLARTAEWTPPPPAAPSSFPGIKAMAAAVALLLAASIAVTRWACRQDDKNSRVTQTAESAVNRDHLSQLATRHISTCGEQLDHALRNTTAGHQAEQPLDEERSS